MRTLVCLLFILLLPLQAFAETVAKITYSEGRVRVIRDASLRFGVPGAGVEATDIIETMVPGFALLEFFDGTVIALGEATRVLVTSHPKGGFEIRVLQGWLKLQARLADNANAYGVVSPVQFANVKNGSLIIHSTESSGEVYVESGDAMLGVLDKNGKASGLSTVKSGRFITRTAEKAASQQSHPSDAFAKNMPKAFRDALPARLDRFKERFVEAKESGLVTYEDVADWLAAPINWRSGFVKRFESRLADSAFRQALDANLKRHRDWDKVLRPSVR